MTAILAAFMVVGFMNWSELSQLRQMTVIFMLLYTLHEWEESRFPGGFYRIFFSKCTIDPTISEERLHLPVAVYLLVILIIPFIYDNITAFALVPLILALFEGFIHTAGIIIHQLKRPYSPGMITAWLMFAYAIIMIPRLNEELMLNAWSWISGILLTIISILHHGNKIHERRRNHHQGVPDQHEESHDQQNQGQKINYSSNCLYEGFLQVLQRFRYVIKQSYLCHSDS